MSGSQDQALLVNDHPTPLCRSHANTDSGRGQLLNKQLNMLLHRLDIMGILGRLALEDLL